MTDRDKLERTSEDHDGLARTLSSNISIEGRDTEWSTTTEESLEREGSKCISVARSRSDEGDSECNLLQHQMSDVSLSKIPTACSDWHSVPSDLQALVLARCPLVDIPNIRSVCRSFGDILEGEAFRQARSRLFPREYLLSPLVFFVENNRWRMLGFEYKAQRWRILPAFDNECVPTPDMELFKDFLVSAHGGVFCANVGKPSESEKIMLFNPLTKSIFTLPALGFPRHPVVLHLHVTLTTNADKVSSRYWIVAVGSSATGTENLSRKTEVFDSCKGSWEAAGDVPGTDFSINEHQSGVYCESENILLVTGFTVHGSKGVLVFDLGTREWRTDGQCTYLQYPFELASPVHFAIAQLVECSGVIYLFSEQEVDRVVTHCIDELELIEDGGFTWTRKVTRPRQGYRALLVYPEYTCVPVHENKLCIYNTIERTGVVYNMLDNPVNPDVFETVPAPPPLKDGIVFHSLNAIGYAFEPSFAVSV